MVQGEKSNSTPCSQMNQKERSQDSRKAGFQAVSQRNQQGKSQVDNKYGAWGPIYKNAEHFKQMHFC